MDDAGAGGGVGGDAVLILRSLRAPEQAERKRGRREWCKMTAGVSKDGWKYGPSWFETLLRNSSP
jgi:hypothetical protein